MTENREIKSVFQNDLQEVINWLEKVKKLDELISAKMAERDQLFALATSLTANLDGMPHGSGISDKVGNAASKLAQVANDIDKQVDKYINHKAEIINALEKLSANQYGALHRHYVLFMPWEEVAYDMDRSYMQVMRYRKKGLKNLQKYKGERRKE